MSLKEELTGFDQADSLLNRPILQLFQDFENFLRSVPLPTKVSCLLVYTLSCFLYLIVVNISDTNSSKVKSFKKNCAKEIVNMWVKD